MARKAGTRGTNGTETTGARKRGGRKPGTWTLVTPEKLKAYRAENRVSRARMAQMLGVSSTSVQNWETGTVASMKIQQRLAELIAAGSAAILPPRKAPSLWDSSSGNGGDAAVKTTGTIVAAYVGGAKNTIEPEELVGLIKSVRAALQ